jgi:hypothetical protein
MAYSSYYVVFLTRLRKSMKTSVNVFGVQADIRTKYIVRFKLLCLLERLRRIMKQSQ